MSCNTINSSEKRITKKISNFLSSAKNELTINISRLNFIEASRMALVNSAKCYASNPLKKINWIVKDESVKNVILPFKLDNMEILTK